MLSETKRLGTIGELAVAQDLMNDGWDVYTAIGDCTKVDIIAIKNKHIVRIQVKTINRLKHGAASVSGSKITSRKRVNYKQDDFDYIALYVIERDQIAYVPIEMVFKSCVSLRFEPTRNGQSKRVHNFNDFVSILP